MKNDVGRSSRTTKSRRPLLDGLEDRQLLSVVGALSRAQPSLLAVHGEQRPVSSTDPRGADRASVAADPRVVDGSRSGSGSAMEVVSSEAPPRVPSRVLVPVAREKAGIRDDVQGSIPGQESTTPAATADDVALGLGVEAAQSDLAAGGPLRVASDEGASPAIPADLTGPRSRGGIGSDPGR